jgi:CheY-like chemotaxis protein
MLEPDDIRWLQAAVNDLNNALQVAEESAHLLDAFCPEHPDARKYCEFLRTSLERAVTVSNKIAGRMEGRPTADSERSATPAASSWPDVSDIHIENPQGARELIMIVDDEPMVIELVSTMLTHADYRVIGAAHALRALEIFRIMGSKVDLVILDFAMPIMDGAAVFRELQNLRSDVAVMLSSGFAEQAVLRGMLARGLRGFLPKPYWEEKLLSQVRSTLDKVRSERPAPPPAS